MYDYEAIDAIRPFVPRLAVYGFSNYRPAPGTPPPAEARKVPPSMPGLWERAANDNRPHESAPVPDPDHSGSLHRRRRPSNQLARGSK